MHYKDSQRRQERNRKSIWRKNWLKTSLTWKSIKSSNSRKWRVPNKMNAKKPTLRHIITKVSKVKDREYLKQQGEERGDRGRDGWMASPTQWTWVRASSGRWWRTGKPGVLLSTGLQRVRHDWAKERNN